jgi:NADH:ubiquinone oxidoreductase subunit H
MYEIKAEDQAVLGLHCDSFQPIESQYFLIVAYIEDSVSFFLPSPHNLYSSRAFLTDLLLKGVLAINLRTLRLSDIVARQEEHWNILPFFPLAFIYLVTMLAETNRAPFDLPESEGELVAGYNLEYTSFVFSLFFLGEYSNMLLMSSIMSLLFLGGWLPLFGLNTHFTIFWFAAKTVFFAYLYILIRSVYPRLRYDQLMYLCWNIFLPYLLIELSLSLILDH